MYRTLTNAEIQSKHISAVDSGDAQGNHHSVGNVL